MNKNQLENKPFYVIRCLRSERKDGRKPWTENNTRYWVAQWPDNFETVEEAQRIIDMEDLDAGIYLVQQIKT